MAKLCIVIFREYWQDQTLTYQCIDTTKGIEAGNNITIGYPCGLPPAAPVGQYATPKEENDWPRCQIRTTTISPCKSQNMKCLLTFLNNILAVFVNMTMVQTALIFIL